MMENGQVRENAEERLASVDMGEAELKFKVHHGSALLEAFRGGIANLVNEVRGKRESTKNIDKLNEAGFAPLHKAAQNDQTDSAKSLLDQCADIDVRTRDDKLTPLHIAAR